MSSVITEQAEKRSYSFQLFSLSNMKRSSGSVVHVTRPLIRVIIKISKKIDSLNVLVVNCSKDEEELCILGISNACMTSILL